MRTYPLLILAGCLGCSDAHVGSDMGIAPDAGGLPWSESEYFVPPVTLEEQEGGLAYASSSSQLFADICRCDFADFGYAGPDECPEDDPVVDSEELLSCLHEAGLGDELSNFYGAFVSWASTISGCFNANSCATRSAACDEEVEYFANGVDGFPAVEEAILQCSGLEP